MNDYIFDPGTEIDGNTAQMREKDDVLLQMKEARKWIELRRFLK